MLSSDEIYEIINKSSTLYERLDFWRKNTNQRPDISISRHFIKKWGEFLENGDSEVLTSRLLAEDIKSAEAEFLLDDLEIKSMKRIPQWAIHLEEGLDFYEKHKDYHVDSFFERVDNDFQSIWNPFLEYALNQIRVKNDEIYNTLSAKAKKSLSLNFLAKINFVSKYVLKIEIQKFSLFQNEKNSMTLESLFISHLLGGGIREILLEYAALSRIIGTILDHWISFINLFLHRLEKDKVEIHSIFSGIDNLGTIENIYFPDKDVEYKANPILIVEFTSGFRLVYKARNINLFRLFNQLIGWVNNKSKFFNIRSTKSICFPEYGWMEFINSRPCESFDEVANYYTNIGRILCLVTILDGSDFHYENLVPSGPDPVLVDLETLFSNQLMREFQNEETRKTEYYGHQKAILRTGLLPLMYNPDENIPLDLSGLAKKTKFSKVLPDPNKQKRNRVLFNGEVQFASDYLAEIELGFVEMYEFISNNSKDLSSVSPLKALFDEEFRVRFVYRPTQIYLDIQKSSLNPKLLKSGLDRSIHIDVLSKSLLNLKIKNKKYWDIIKKEHEILTNWDIPRFFSSSTDGTIFDEKRREKYFISSPRGRLINRLKVLSNNDLTNQLKLINLSLSNSQNQLKNVNVESLSSQDIENTSTYVEEAINIYNLILSISSDDDNSNIGWTIYSYDEYYGQPILKPLGNNFYSGILGIGLFTAAISKVLSLEPAELVTNRVLNPFRENLNNYSFLNKYGQVSNIGGTEGLGGTIYCLAKIGKWLDDDSYIQDALKVSRIISRKKIISDSKFDVMSGSAGLILGLLALYNITGSKDVLETAQFCGKHILKNLTGTEQDLLTIPFSHTKTVYGFAHGATGIKYALIKLFHTTKNPIFLQSSRGIHSHLLESSLVKHKNKDQIFQVSRPLSWCRGNVGIELARLGTISDLNEVAHRGTFQLVFDEVISRKGLDLDHLCCGNMGIVEYLVLSGEKFKNEDAQTATLKIINQVIKKKNETGKYQLSTKYSNDVFDPSFFRGLSGIGYQLLRTAFPNILTSVLIFE